MFVHRSKSGLQLLLISGGAYTHHSSQHASALGHTGAAAGHLQPPAVSLYTHNWDGDSLSSPGLAGVPSTPPVWFPLAPTPPTTTPPPATPC